jgi:hypothetical protein
MAGSHFVRRSDCGEGEIVETALFARIFSRARLIRFRFALLSDCADFFGVFHNPPPHNFQKR